MNSMAKTSMGKMNKFRRKENDALRVNYEELETEDASVGRYVGIVDDDILKN